MSLINEISIKISPRKYSLFLQSSYQVFKKRNSYGKILLTIILNKDLTVHKSPKSLNFELDPSIFLSGLYSIYPEQEYLLLT